LTYGSRLKKDEKMKKALLMILAIASLSSITYAQDITGNYGGDRGV